MGETFVHFSQYIPPTAMMGVTGTYTQAAGAVTGTIALHRAAAASTGVITIPIMLHKFSPMPTLPFCSTTRLVPVEEPTTNCGAPLRRPFPFTERRPHGVVEPIPTKALA